MTAVIEAHGLGRRYRGRWALTECTLSIPPGRVVGLVGPNGAGKSTLLNLACGRLRPTVGTIRVLGHRPGDGAGQLARVGFVAQDTPVYTGLSVADHLRFGARMNPAWDHRAAHRRIEQLGLDPRQKAGRLSGGQRAQLALTLAAAKQPELLLLDEPVAALDPLARRSFLHGLTEFAGEREGRTVVLSSHVITDLERVCDYLLLVSGGRVRLAGPCEELIAGHHRITGPRRAAAALPEGLSVVRESHTGQRSSFVVRADAPLPGGDWHAERPGLEDLVLAYLARDPHDHTPQDDIPQAHTPQDGEERR
ncbi:ABC transporter ATP-binding protein [Streptomyces sp. CBMA156]|uniref:ABC transporter ATP-binding protein n=1 Tax=Streptomyces sp. CBMA156 TaxID=1930280 RepID=UPI0016619827|nr:ABC transporter ATP-binding protein [Streptomyces sp. CBMA156]MBD0671748.1 ABC transporter ATP-binding protein [Streptomyces sp. CBMA156]